MLTVAWLVFAVGASPLCAASARCGLGFPLQGLLLSRGIGSGRSGFSNCSSQVPGTGSVVGGTGFVVLWQVGPSRTRD